MPDDNLFSLPAKPFFSCDEDGFAVVDGAAMRNAGNIGSIEPMLLLRVGPNNLFEHRPRRVTDQDGQTVTVECDGGVTVVLDFAELTARLRRPDGEFLYMGGLDEGNAGLGFMAAR